MNEDEKRAAIVAEALTWEKTPHHHMGRVKGAGVDCGMFLLEVYERCGLIPHVDPGYYVHDWHLNRSEEQYLGWVRKFARPIHEYDREPTGIAIKPGDIALYQFGRCISHGAIVMDWPRVIHAYIGQGVRQEDSGEENLKGRLRAIYRLNAFED